MVIDYLQQFTFGPSKWTCSWTVSLLTTENGALSIQQLVFGRRLLNSNTRRRLNKYSIKKDNHFLWPQMNVCIIYVNTYTTRKHSKMQHNQFILAEVVYSPCFKSHLHRKRKPLEIEHFSTHFYLVQVRSCSHDVCVCGFSDGNKINSDKTFQQKIYRCLRFLATSPT